jgi:hypothetical protein
VLDARVWLVIAASGCNFVGTLSHVDAPVPVDTAPDVFAMQPCPDADASTIALYRFEDAAPAADDAGDRDGNVHNTVQIDGPPGCGRAIRFPAGQQAFVDIVDDPVWTLASGSVELWIRRAGTQPAGILSRDALNTIEDGHLTLVVSGDGRLAVRLQDQAEAGGQLVCSDDILPTLTWLHVGINFGPPRVELFVDGRLQQAFTGTTPAFGGNPTCTTNVVRDLGDNGNPWVLGAETTRGVDGTGAPRNLYFEDGAVDHLMISAVRRDFAAR